jgi:hypothetical protein
MIIHSENACVDGIELFYSNVTLVILPCIKNIITKITPHNPQKTFMSRWKDHFTPEMRAKDKMTKGKNSNYTIVKNSNMFLRAQ